MLLVSALSSQAAQLSGNLPSNDGGKGEVTLTTLRGITFTTSTDEFEVTSVTLRLDAYLSASDVAFLTFHKGTTSAPGTLVGSLTAPASTNNGYANFVFLPTTAITLEANTLYWLVLAAGSAQTDFSWVRSDPSSNPTGTATFGNQQISDNAGATWSVGSNGPHSFAIDGNTVSPVPEPGAVVLFIVGATVMLAVMRRSRVAGMQRE